VVKQYKLWPRAMTDAPATEADFRTYEAYAERERYRPQENVDTSFEGQDGQDGKDGQNGQDGKAAEDPYPTGKDADETKRGIRSR
jgi:hypothetical protein